MHMKKRRKANWVGHILCRNIIEWEIGGRIKVMRRQDISSYMMTLKRREKTGN